MNSSQFMDKQITGLSGSQNSEFFELLQPQDDSGNGKNEEIFPSFDFQPIRPAVASQIMNLESNRVDGARVWNSADSKTNASNIRKYSSLDSNETAKVTQDKVWPCCDVETVFEIDRTMKKHADNMLHALEGISARLSQLELRTRHLESSVDDLKVSAGNNYGSTDGKLRQLENILREVQNSVQVLRDKQEIAEAQLQLAKLQSSKEEPQSENQNNVPQPASVQQVASVPQQSHHLLPSALSIQPPSQPLASLPPNAPPPPPLPIQNHPQLQLPTQLPQTHIPPIQHREQYFPPAEATHQQFQAQAPHQPYQLAPPPHYSQPPQPSLQQPLNPSPPQPQPIPAHHPEETPYIPPQSYPSSVRQPPSIPHQPSSGTPPSQQYYGTIPQMYEPPSNRSSSGYTPGYGPPSGPSYNDSHPYMGSYGSSTMKPPQLPSSPSAPRDGTGFSRLPTAQLLPHALPTATSVNSSSESNSGSSSNRVPVDDVVDKVATMGFSRDQVRATVKKLTENGQSVDLNVVLDKLMNDGEIQPQKGWFGR